MLNSLLRATLGRRRTDGAFVRVAPVVDPPLPLFGLQKPLNVQRSFIVGSRTRQNQSAGIIFDRYFKAEDSLSEIVDALDGVTFFFGFGERGKEEAGEDCDDGDNDEEFDQREG